MGEYIQGHFGHVVVMVTLQLADALVVGTLEYLLHSEVLREELDDHAPQPALHALGVLTHDVDYRVGLNVELVSLRPAPQASRVGVDDVADLYVMRKCEGEGECVGVKVRVWVGRCV